MMKVHHFLGALFAASLCIQGNIRATAAEASTAPEAQKSWLPQGIVVEHTLQSFQQVEDRWKAGDTNFPLVSIEWFLSGTVTESMVFRDGRVVNGNASDFNSHGWGPWGPLERTNLSKLKELLNALPSAPATVPPLSRQILVYGIRSNSCFSKIYDRADVPKALEQICDLSGGRIDWVVQSVTSTTNTTLSQRDGWIHAITAATSTPVVASTSAEAAQVWNLATWQGNQVPNRIPVLQTRSRNGVQSFGTNYFSPSAWSPVVLSPDGGQIVLADYWRVLCLDVGNMTQKWLRPRYADYPRGTEEERVQWCMHLALLDGGKALAVGLFDRIEKWSFATGETESVFSTNGVPFEGALKSTPDGNVLAADFDQGRILVWKAPWTGAAQEVVEPSYTRLLAISPTGRYLALRGFGRLGERLIILNLATGTREEMRFRGCVSHEWVTGMAWSPDEAYAAVDQQSGGDPVIYDARTWEPLARWDLPYSGPLGRRITFSAGGWLVARASGGALYGLKLPLR